MNYTEDRLEISPQQHHILGTVPYRVIKSTHFQGFTTTFARVRSRYWVISCKKLLIWNGWLLQAVNSNIELDSHFQCFWGSQPDKLHISHSFPDCQEGDYAKTSGVIVNLLKPRACQIERIKAVQPWWMKKRMLCYPEFAVCASDGFFPFLSIPETNKIFLVCPH